MRKAGQVAILHFPDVDLTPGKSRPVLLIARAPGAYEDWLTCMFSTQLQQAVAGFDEILDATQDDYNRSGLKLPSVIRVSRLAVVSADMLAGAIGEISYERLQRIRHTLADWIQGQ